MDHCIDIGRHVSARSIALRRKALTKPKHSSRVSSSPLHDAPALEARHNDLKISFFFSNNCSQEVGLDNQGHAVAEITYYGNQDNYMKCHVLPSGLGSFQVTGTATTGCGLNPPNGKGAYDYWLITDRDNCGTEYGVGNFCSPTDCAECKGECGAVEYTLMTTGAT